MDQLITFLQDRWLVVLVALIALILVVKIVKIMLKWVIVILIVAALLWYGSSFVGKLHAADSAWMQGLRQEAVKELQTKDMTYKENADGTFTITSNGISMSGSPDSNTVKITYKGFSFSQNRNQFIDEIIAQAKARNAS